MSRLPIVLFISLFFSYTISNYSFSGASSLSSSGTNLLDPTYSNGIYHNPASNAYLSKINFSSSFSFLHSQKFLPYTTAGIAMKAPLIGRISISFENLSVDYLDFNLSKELSARIASGFFIQKDQNSKMAFGYAFNLHSWGLSSSAGLSGDGSDGISGTSLYSFGIDIGFLANLREQYWMACYIKNINSPIVGYGTSSQYLKRSIDIGIGYEPIEGLRTNLVFNKPINENKINSSASVNYKLNKMIDFVIGLSTNPNRISTGLTINITRFSIKYGFMSHPVLNDTHAFEIGFSL